MKRKSAFIIMLCLYLVTGAAACAILISPDLRSAISAVSFSSEKADLISLAGNIAELISPAGNIQENTDTSSDTAVPSDHSELSEAAAQPAPTEQPDTIDSSAVSESSGSAVLPTQPESSETTDPSARTEQGQVSQTPDSSAAAFAQDETKEEAKYRGIANQDEGKRLFIRKSPSTDGEVLGVLYTGQSGEVLDIGEEWVLLKYGDIEGYVFKKFLIIEELPQSEDPQGL